MEGILEAWIEQLEGILDREALTVADLRIGVFYTVARLSTGHTALAFTPRDLSDAVCCPRTAAEAPPAGRMAGMDAWTLARYALSPVPLRRAVGVAVLNALSALAMARHGTPGGTLLRGVDALEVAEIQPEDRVAMVGAFVPFIKALKGRAADLRIVDKHSGALKPDELPLWRPPEQAAETISQATVVVITGSALIEGGLDALLDTAGRARRVVLAGPTASSWPPPFFARGLDVLAGIRVHDGEQMLRLVTEGGSGIFFDAAAEKVAVVRDRGRR